MKVRDQVIGIKAIGSLCNRYLVAVSSGRLREERSHIKLVPTKSSAYVRAYYIFLTRFNVP